MIAFFLMLCDHIGFMLIENGVLYGQNSLYWNMALSTQEGQNWYLAARILRTVGRLSFPLFAFLVSEGFLHTQSTGKYLFRMGAFAVLSEVPFDMAGFGRVWYPDYQNVLFTYFLAILAMDYMEKAKSWPGILRAAIAAPFCWIAAEIRCDYGALGVALICLMYLLRSERKIRLWTGAALSAAESLPYYGISALSFLLLKTYNGTRGSFSLKYFFYLMYPLHLVLFYVLVRLANP